VGEDCVGDFFVTRELTNSRVLEWRNRIIEVEKERLIEDEVSIDGAFTGKLEDEVDP
jgi:hypothetical protein